MKATINGYQAMAWIAWRTPKAAKIFGGDDAEKLWAEAMEGKFPAKLGQPKVKPAIAKMQLEAALTTGELSFTRVRGSGR